MAKAFADRKITAEGKVLPFEQFKLFCDVDELTPNPKTSEHVIKLAEQALDEQIPPLPATLYMEFFNNGNRNNFETPYFRRRTIALACALAEKCTGSGRYIDKCIDAVWAIMEESTWVIPAHLYVSRADITRKLFPAHDDKLLHGIDLFAASTAGVLAIVLYLLEDELDEITPVICEKIRWSLKERITKPYLNSTFWWTGDDPSKTVNNWGPWIISNVLLSVAVSEKSMFVRERCVDKAMGTLDAFMKNYHSDGGCDEGPAYWAAAGASLFDSLELISDMTGGAIQVYDHPLIKAIGEYEMRANIHGLYFINFADSAPTVSLDGTMVRRFGQKCGSERLVSFGDSILRSVTQIFELSHAYRATRRVFSKDEPQLPYTPYKTSWLDGIKVVAMRENESADEGMFFAMKGGHNAEMHNHNDVGTFMVYYNAKPVIIDTGVGQYTQKTFSPQRYELWYMQSSYHNLPDINGCAQREGRRYASKCEMFNESERTLSLDLTDAYVSEAKIKSYTRSGSLVGGVVRVVDTLTLSEECDVDFHFMTHIKPELSADGKTVLLAEGRTLMFDASLTPEIEEFEADDARMESLWHSKVLYRIHLRCRTEQGSYTFIIK